MPIFERNGTSIYFEEHGSGFPVLLLAPGGLDSNIAAWPKAAINPLEVYKREFGFIAMDQRNSGQSKGPLDAKDPWGSYIEDQLGLMDHLGIDRFHAFGCCIGCAYALKLIERGGDRVVSAVLEQPIGIVPENHAGWVTRRSTWATGLLATRDDLDQDTADRFGAEMWDRDFVGSVSKEFVATITTPICVLPGVDAIHPTAIGREVARLAPGAVSIEPWKEPAEALGAATDRVRKFLFEHTPA